MESPLSCALFLLYIGDLPKWVGQGQTQGYADDTIHFVTGDNEQQVIEILESAASDILSYFASNELVANLSKTAFLMFCPGKITNKKAVANIGGTHIVESESERILGIQVQNTLKWDDHIAKVISKVNYGLATLRQLKGLLNQKAMAIIAEGLVMSHIRYGISVYLTGNSRIQESETVDQKLNKLQIKQNDTLRLILKKTRKDRLSRETMLQKCNMLSINQLTQLSTLMETWKAFFFRNETITIAYHANKSQRNGTVLRTSLDPTSFISKSSRLWNLAGETFHNSKTVIQAKRYANDIIRTLNVI